VAGRPQAAKSSADRRKSARRTFSRVLVTVTQL
jgi:hypothetical protein